MNFLRSYGVTIFLIALGILIRFYLLPFSSDDFHYFFSPWYEEVRRLGFSAVGGTFYNYTPHYILFLWFGSFLEPELSPLTIIKLPSLFFELILAAGAGRIARSFAPQGEGRRVFFRAFAIVYLIPTVVLNGAAWGQIEAMYAAAVVWSVAILVRKRDALPSLKAHLAFGLGFASKLQSIFIAPLFFVLYLRRKLNPVDLIYVPAIYLALMVPARIAGRSLHSLLTIYLNQSNVFQSLSMNAANLYLWIPNEYYPWVYPRAVVLTAIILLGLCLLFAKKLKNIGPREILTLAAFFTWLAPNLLPKMHDRYFYVAEVFAVAYALTERRENRTLSWALAVTIQFAGLLAYLNYLGGVQVIPQAFWPLLQIAAAAMWFVLLHRLLKTTHSSNAVPAKAR